MYIFYTIQAVKLKISVSNSHSVAVIFSLQTMNKNCFVDHKLSTDRIPKNQWKTKFILLNIHLVVWPTVVYLWTLYAHVPKGLQQLVRGKFIYTKCEIRCPGNGNIYFEQYTSWWNEILLWISLGIFIANISQKYSYCMTIFWKMYGPIISNTNTPTIQ